MGTLFVALASLSVFAGFWSMDKGGPVMTGFCFAVAVMFGLNGLAHLIRDGI